MRELADDIRAGLDAEMQTFARAWVIARRDGIRLGFTDHDEDLMADGVLCRSGAGFGGPSGAVTAELVDDAARVGGGLDDGVLRAEDLAAGAYDGAICTHWRVDWREPGRAVRLWSGALGRVERSGADFRGEIESAKAALGRTFGRVFVRRCDATLGDARCGVDLDVAGRSAMGAVAEVRGDRTFRVSGLEAMPAGALVHGALSWTRGGGAEITAHRIAGGVVLELLEPPPFDALGEAFTARVGCDRSFATCVGVFGNAARFRGFPHMPGLDPLLAGPNGEEPRDGGSRFR